MDAELLEGFREMLARSAALRTPENQHGYPPPESYARNLARWRDLKI